MDTTEKETIVAEVKSPVPSQETVEAAKQILTDVLEKAVDAIKETSLLSSTTSTAEATKDEAESDKTFRFGSSLGKFALDETITDYIVKCQWEGKTYLVGEWNTFAKSIASARGFSTEKEALDYIKKYQSGEKQACTSLSFVEGEVMMRTIKCQLNEIGHGE